MSSNIVECKYLLAPCWHRYKNASTHSPLVYVQHTIKINIAFCDDRSEKKMYGVLMVTTLRLMYYIDAISRLSSIRQMRCHK